MDDLETAADMYKKPISFLSRINSMICKGSFIPSATISPMDCFLLLAFPFTCLAAFLYPGLSGFEREGVGDNDLLFPAAKSNKSCFSLRSSGRSGRGEPLSSKGSIEDFLLSFLVNGSPAFFWIASPTAGLSLCFLWYSVKWGWKKHYIVIQYDLSKDVLSIKRLQLNQLICSIWCRHSRFKYMYNSYTHAQNWLNHLFAIT